MKKRTEAWVVRSEVSRGKTKSGATCRKNALDGGEELHGVVYVERRAVSSGV